jgi:UDP-N-acetyl-D-galactosamine dehydrogenase
VLFRLAVSHNEFKTLDIATLKADNSVLFDVKAFLDRNSVDARL